MAILLSLPEQDQSAPDQIVDQMRQDEIQHAETAVQS
jgi:demethoxyubiquinone hydroxylase (CLK1/Coq7/Cat5 family)